MQLLAAQMPKDIGGARAAEDDGKERCRLGVGDPLTKLCPHSSCCHCALEAPRGSACEPANSGLTFVVH